MQETALVNQICTQRQAKEVYSEQRTVNTRFQLPAHGATEQLACTQSSAFTFVFGKSLDIPYSLIRQHPTPLSSSNHKTILR